MDRLFEIYKKVGKLEELIASILIVLITASVFGSAVGRVIGHPIIWALDAGTLMFAWLVFIGADIVVRNTQLAGVEILANRFPSKLQKALKVLWFVIIIAFCATLCVTGVNLCLSNVKRSFSSFHLSYSWCTLSVPVGCFLMIISSSIRLVEIIKTPASEWKQVKSAKKGAKK